MKFQDRCPDCGNEAIEFEGRTYLWYAEDGTDDINPMGFHCKNCHGPAGIEEKVTNLIQLKFFGSQFSFQNENALVEGQIIDQSHQIDLLMWAMELARDEGKKLRLIYENGTLHFKAISDKDIETHCK